MKRILDFNDMVAIIMDFKTQYTMLMYANAMLFDHLKDKKLHHCLNENGNFMLVAQDADFSKALKFNSSYIIHLVEMYAEHRYMKDIPTTCDELMKKNAHFLRTRVLNGACETILHYLKSVKKEGILDSFPWYQMLYLLRNNASHFDNYNAIIKIPAWMRKHAPKGVHWNGLTITHEQNANDVIYNDEYVLRLIDSAMILLQQNESMFV